MARALTQTEFDYYASRMVRQGVAAHFTNDGGTFDPTNGETVNDRYANVINKLTFWNFTADDAREIADLCGVKVKVAQ